ncbi:hypothetical protein ACTU44_08830 [Thalassospira sp. SM2505]
MKRIDTQTKATDKFGAGKHGFTNGNPTIPTPATELDESWFDHVQEEIANFIEEQGIALDENNRTQLAAAITAKLANGNYLRGNVSAVLTAGFNTEFMDLTVAGGVASFDPTARSRFKHALTGPIMIDNPAVIPNAGPALIKLTQDATGNRAVDWGSKYRVVGAVNYEANSVSLCHLQYDSADDVIDVVITHRPEA